MISARKYTILLSIIIYFASRENCYAFEIPSEEKYKAGEKTLQDFQAKAKNSECWRDAIENLEVGCKKLTDVEQSYLAVDFANCHLKKSGRRTYNCSRDKSIEECTRNMDDLAFNAYTTFFTHTTNICFYLQSQAWQERTEETVSKLSKTSEEVAGQLENSLRNQIIVLQHQNQSLKNQKEIIQHEKKLSVTLKSSTSEAKQAFDDMKTKANEQKAIFSETFEGIFKSVENIKQLQAMILGEFITLQSLAFHFVAVCVCYFFTSCPRTASARLGLFVGLAVLIITERAVSSSSIGAGEATDTELVHFRLWLCRKVFIFGATLGLLVAAYRYQDLNRINHCLLQEIQQQIRDLKALQAADTTSGSNIKAIMNDESSECTHRALSLSHSWAGFQNSTTIAQTSRDYIDCGNDKNSEHSYDDTYIPDETVIDSSSSESDYESVNCSESISESFLLDQNVSTPQLSRRSSGRLSSTPRNSQSKLKTSRRSDVSPSHHYNLRPRRSNQSSPYVNNGSFRNMPSPSTLEELVHTLKQSSKQYTAVMKQNRGSGKELFSSDEE